MLHQYMQPPCICSVCWMRYFDAATINGASCREVSLHRTPDKMKFTFVMMTPTCPPCRSMRYIIELYWKAPCLWNSNYFYNSFCISLHLWHYALAPVSVLFITFNVSVYRKTLQYIPDVCHCVFSPPSF